MEKSSGGANIYRYDESVDRSGPSAPTNPEQWQQIAAHITKHIGPIAATYHERASDLISLYLHVVGPNRRHDCYCIVTSGMSDLPMKTPERCEALRFGELMICLPSDWPMDPVAWEDHNYYWPIMLLKYLARFPHVRDSWLFATHTIPNGNPRPLCREYRHEWRTH